MIGDHIRRWLLHCRRYSVISNNDRNYVLRRILRRAVRHGRTLGFRNVFYKLVDVLADGMGEFFPELQQRRELVQQTIRTEEEPSTRPSTAASNCSVKKLIAQVTPRNSPVSRQAARHLRLPARPTELMAREAGLSVNTAGFETLMEQQRERARAAQKKEASVSSLSSDAQTGLFDQLTADATVLEVVEERRHGTSCIVPRFTPRWAASGLPAHSPSGINRETDTQRPRRVPPFCKRRRHAGAGAAAQLTVDAAHRAAIQRHHTVTHLFHWALHQVTSDAHGSYVGG